MTRVFRGLRLPWEPRSPRRSLLPRRVPGSPVTSSSVSSTRTAELERESAGDGGHFPGIKIVTPATIEDARGMLATALADPDPVLIFENSTLYNRKGQLAPEAGAVDIERARVHRAGRDVSLLTYGASLFKSLDAAAALAEEGIAAEVIDLRTLRPLDDETFIGSVTRTHRAVIVDEGWRSGRISAEISAP